jgi:hypothetical protein
VAKFKPSKTRKMPSLEFERTGTFNLTSSQMFSRLQCLIPALVCEISEHQADRVIRMERALKTAPSCPSATTVPSLTLGQTIQKSALRAAIGEGIKSLQTIWTWRQFSSKSGQKGVFDRFGFIESHMTHGSYTSRCGPYVRHSGPYSSHPNVKINGSHAIRKVRIRSDSIPFDLQFSFEPM